MDQKGIEEKVLEGVLNAQSLEEFAVAKSTIGKTSADNFQIIPFSLEALLLTKNADYLFCR